MNSQQFIKQEIDTDPEIKTEQNAEVEIIDVKYNEIYMKQEIEEDIKHIPEIIWLHTYSGDVDDDFKTQESPGKVKTRRYRKATERARKQYTPQCPECDEKFSKDEELNDHYRENESHKPKRFQCFSCTKSYDDLAELRLHQAIHEEEKKRKRIPHAVPPLQKCHICGRDFDSADHLYIHSKEHSGPRFGCEKCGETFVGRKALITHLEFGHAQFDNGKIQYRCSFCKKKFQLLSEVEKHVVSHRLHHKFACSICGQRFVAEPLLEAHIILHQGQDVYECPLCAKCFSAELLLQHHVCIPILTKISSESNLENYLDRETTRYTDDEFRQNFRMNKSTFQHVLVLISDKIKWHMLSERAQLQMALWYFGNPESFRRLYEQFKVTKLALSSVKRVVEALFELAPSVITWPNGDNLENVRKEFSTVGLPGAIGSLGSTYIRVPRPKSNKKYYICKESFPCVILQAVCDHTLKFTHCYAEQGGSVQNTIVLFRSQLWTFMNKHTKDMFPDNTYVVGDKTYPCLPQLITPYKETFQLSEEVKQFNHLLCRRGNVIQKALNLLQERFRCLSGILDAKKVDRIQQFIIACCVLHNICIMQGDTMEVDESAYWYNYYHEVDEAETEVINNMLLTLGSQKRDEICGKLLA